MLINTICFYFWSLRQQYKHTFLQLSFCFPSTDGLVLTAVTTCPPASVHPLVLLRLIPAPCLQQELSKIGVFWCNELAFSICAPAVRPACMYKVVG